MGLLGGVFNHRHAIGQDGRQHDIHGSAHRDHIQVDLRTDHTAIFSLGVNKPAPYVYLGPHGHKPFDVLINGPAAEVTAAGRRHLG